MDTIELIKEFETTGFSRIQAEVQVKTMADIKKGLMTQSDGKIIYKDLGDKIDFVDRSLSAKIDVVDRSLSAKIDVVDRSLSAKIDVVDRSLSAKIELLDDKIDLLAGKMDARFQGVELAFKVINDRFSALDTKISLGPVINTIYMLGLLLMYLGFTKFGPLIQDWLLGLQNL